MKCRPSSGRKQAIAAKMNTKAKRVKITRVIKARRMGRVWPRR